MTRGAAHGMLAAAFALWAGMVAIDAARQEAQAPVAPRLLSETGLFLPGGTTIDPRNRPFAPQYPLWTDGAEKHRWVRLPEGSKIDTSDPGRWDFPVGTRFWKEFRFAGRPVETRFLWHVSREQWVFASYVWDAEGREAVRAPDAGVPRAAEIAPGKFHAVPGFTECRSCHDSQRTEILGFDAIQLSTDRDPGAPHADRVRDDMVTLATLVGEGRLSPPRAEWVTSPPRIAASTPVARSAIGYLSTNCGPCHNDESTIASVGLQLKYRVRPVDAAATREATCPPAVATTVGRHGHWVVPGASEAESMLVNPGRPGLSALVVRARSRRPASQMPPIGSVVVDREGVDLLTRWIADAEGLAACAVTPTR